MELKRAMSSSSEPEERQPERGKPGSKSSQAAARAANPGRALPARGVVVLPLEPETSSTCPSLDLNGQLVSGETEGLFSPSRRPQVRGEGPGGGLGREAPTPMGWRQVASWRNSLV